MAKKMKTVIITGASTGIGEACARHLAAQGWRVFAGVRRAEDAEKLLSEAITPLLLDVTQAQSIQAAADTVRAALPNAVERMGLVNNAGIAFPAPLEFVPAAELERHFAVNVAGGVAMIQAFLPLLRQAQNARIVNMGSVGGRSAVPYFGAYCASKFALEGISDALRVELRPWGIGVALIEPGAIDTPIWGKSAAGELFADYPPEAWALYGGTLRFLSKVLPRMKGSPPQNVVAAVEHALGSPRPKARYVIGRDAQQRLWLERLPTRLRDYLMAKRMTR